MTADRSAGQAAGPGAPGSAPGGKRCMVAYATRERQFLWNVELPAGALIADALAVARDAATAAQPEIAALVPWETAAVGIFGEPRARTDPCADGDRIELYRPLRQDPRTRRRERVQREQRARRGRGA